MPITTIWPELLLELLLDAADAALEEPRPLLPVPTAAGTHCFRRLRSRNRAGHELADREIHRGHGPPRWFEVSEASFRFVWAVESDDSADVTEAWSVSSVLCDAPAAWSLESRSWAEVSCACAALTSSESAVVSTVAST